MPVPHPDQSDLLDHMDVIREAVYDLNEKMSRLQEEIDEIQSQRLQPVAMPRYVTEPLINSLDEIPDKRGGDDMAKTIKKFEPDYPAIKKAAWEAWRIFFPAFLAAIALQVQMDIDWQDPYAWTRSTVAAAAIAGWKALWKVLREKWGNGDYSKLIYKLPS